MFVYNSTSKECAFHSRVSVAYNTTNDAYFGMHECDKGKTYIQKHLKRQVHNLPNTFGPTYNKTTTKKTHTTLNNMIIIRHIYKDIYTPSS